MASSGRAEEVAATRSAWRALEGWRIVARYRASKGGGEHTVSRQGSEWSCTCANYVYRQRRFAGFCKHIRRALAGDRGLLGGGIG